jgi:membrane protein
MGTPRTAEPPGRLARLVRWPHDIVLGVARALPQALDDLFRDRCPQYAASIAFHVLFSLFPLTILLVSIFGLVLQDDDLRARVVSELLDVLPVSESGQRNVESSIDQIASPLSAIGLVSLVALLWGASGMMASIRIGLEAALKVERGRPAAHAKLVDFVLVGAAGLLVLAVIGISTFAAFFSRSVEYLADQIGVEVVTNRSGALVRDGLQLFLIAFMTVMLYRFVPAGRLRRQAVLVGATFTAVGIWGASKLLAVLLDFTRYNVIYGSLAGVMTFLFFVYVVSLILLLGAEFAYAWSQPPGPPGPPLRTQVKNFLLGLVVHPDPLDADSRADDVSAQALRRSEPANADSDRENS